MSLLVVLWLMIAIGTGYQIEGWPGALVAMLIILIPGAGLHFNAHRLERRRIRKRRADLDQKNRNL